jgi:hypothetical protein
MMSELFRSKDGIKFILIALSLISTLGTLNGQKEVVSGFNCDFEKKNLCGWIQTTDSNHNWVIKEGITGDGPKFDHTTNTAYGRYIYFDTYDYDYYDYYDDEEDKKAKLMSPKIDGSVEQCFKFWYHMDGFSVGELSVHYLVRSSGELVQIEDPAWRRRENHGDHWQLGRVPYAGANSSVENFILQGLADYYSFGEIAVDDIELTLGECEVFEFETVTCDFEEEHICGYTSDDTADFNWSRERGLNLPFGIGPGVDVTSGSSSGYFMYTKTYVTSKKGQEAILKSPIQPYETGKCLSFWYHVHGDDLGGLNVYSQLETSKNEANTSRNLIWSINRNQPKNWYIARVPTDYKVDFKIIFQGIIGETFRSDMVNSSKQNKKFILTKLNSFKLIRLSMMFSCRVIVVQVLSIVILKIQSIVPSALGLI